MKIAIVVIDSILLVLFTLVYLENAKFQLFGVDMGIWSIPLFLPFVLIINIFALLFSPISRLFRKSVFYFDSFLVILCLAIFFYDAYPALFPPAIFAIGLSPYLKFIGSLWFLGMNAYGLNWGIHDDENHKKAKVKGSPIKGRVKRKNTSPLQKSPPFCLT